MYVHTVAEDEYEQLELQQLVDHSIKRKWITYLSIVIFLTQKMSNIFRSQFLKCKDLIIFL